MPEILRTSPEFPITVTRGLLTDCMALITAAKHDRHTGGEVAGVIVRLQSTLELAAREPNGEATND